MFMEWKWGAYHLEVRRVDRESFQSLNRLAIGRNSYGVNLLGIHIAKHEEKVLSDVIISV